jgi:hypothetical protein
MSNNDALTLLSNALFVLEQVVEFPLAKRVVKPLALVCKDLRTGLTALKNNLGYVEFKLSEKE